MMHKHCFETINRLLQDMMKNKLIFGGKTIVSATYPGVGGPDPRFVDAFEPFPNGPLLQGAQDTHTDISQKPRAEIIEYKVENGDTLSGNLPGDSC